MADRDGYPGKVKMSGAANMDSRSSASARISGIVVCSIFSVMGVVWIFLVFVLLILVLCDLCIGLVDCLNVFIYD